MAQEIAAAIYSDMIRDKFNIPVKNKSQRLFPETYQEYLKNISNSLRTVMNNNIALKHFLPVFKDKNITDITISDVMAYQLQRRLEIMNKNSGKKESEINFDWLNKEILILSNFFNFCIEKGYLDKNPAQRIKKLNTLSRIKNIIRRRLIF